MRPTFIARPAALCRALVLVLIIGAVTASTVAAHFNGTPNSSISKRHGARRRRRDVLRPVRR